jgi:hypothetical protein
MQLPLLFFVLVSTALASPLQSDDYEVINAVDKGTISAGGLPFLTPRNPVFVAPRPVVIPKVKPPPVKEPPAKALPREGEATGSKAGPKAGEKPPPRLGVCALGRRDDDVDEEEELIELGLWW